MHKLIQPNLFGCHYNLNFLGRLRTVPTYVSAHTFCASRDTRVSYRWCLYRDIFARSKTVQIKRNLTSHLVSKNKIGGNIHFSEIIKLQFGKKINTIHCFVFYCFFFFLE